MLIPQVEVPPVAAPLAQRVEQLAGVVVVVLVVGEVLRVCDAGGGDGVGDVVCGGGDDGVVGAGEQGAGPGERDGVRGVVAEVFDVGVGFAHGGVEGDAAGGFGGDEEWHTGCVGRLLVRVGLAGKLGCEEGSGKSSGLMWMEGVGWRNEERLRGMLRMVELRGMVAGINRTMAARTMEWYRARGCGGQ